MGNRGSVDAAVEGDVTPDPAEGVTGDGIISTGASTGNLHPAYARLLDEAVGTLRAALGAALHSVYVYGSVATGQARPPPQPPAQRQDTPSRHDHAHARSAAKADGGAPAACRDLPIPTTGAAGRLRLRPNWRE